MFRLLTLATIFIGGSIYAALAQSAATHASQDTWSVPVLRSSVTITGDIVRIGDVVDNAGTAAQIAILRAPDLGTTASLPTSQLIPILRTHQVIGVDTRNLREISVTRASRTVPSKDIELQVGRALQRRNSLGDASSLSVTLDRDLHELQLDASSSGDMKPAIVRFDSRNGRFDVTFEIENANSSSPTRVRFTGTAVETVETAVLTRNTERNEILKASDVVIERRPKAEAGTDAANRDRAVGMQTRRQLRSGQILKAAVLPNPIWWRAIRALPSSMRRQEFTSQAEARHLKTAPKATPSAYSIRKRSAPFRVL